MIWGKTPQERWIYLASCLISVVLVIGSTLIMLVVAKEEDSKCEAKV